MAEKFPEINSDVQTDDLSEDFLTREKQLLGDEFKTEQDDELLKDDEDAEVKKFEEQFPDVSENQESNVDPVNGNNAAEDDDEDFSEPVFNPPKTETDAVKEWRERYQLEITKRDEEDAKKTKETREAAEKQLDDFYESYNNKKEENISKARESEKEFIAKRDEFFSKGDVWSRSLDLIKDAKVNQRFKELLENKSKATKV